MITDASLIQRDWLGRLDAEMRREVACQRAAAEEIWALPLAQRLAEGRSLGPLRVVAASQRRLTLRPDSPAAAMAPCLLREGDFVRLSLNTPTAPLAHAVLLGEDHAGLHLEFGGSGFKPGPDIGWTIDPDFLDLSNLFGEAIDALAMTGDGRERILPLLMGETGSRLDGERFESEMESFAAPADPAAAAAWHPAQQEAIAACLAAHDAFLVQGPPGTGKTRVLAETARRLLDEGARVLVTGPTHRAIHHALGAIRRTVPAALRVAKIGPAPLGGEGVECHDTYQDSGLLDCGEPHVIGATPHALWSRVRGLRESMFDTVLIDEASQITPLLAAMAMLRAERWLFFGDDRQLPPVVLAATATPPRLRSVFGVLKGRDFDLMLTETWRLGKTLAEWPSVTFYGNRLSTRHDRRLRLEPDSALPELRAEAPLVLHVAEGRGHSVRNEEEAEQVARLVADLIRGGVAPEAIGVITPFRAQAALIRQRLARVAAQPDLRHLVLVDTVERFQGQEREVMVISMAASNAGFIARRADFLFQPERLNVALTRARLKTVLVAARGLLECAASLADSGHEGAVCFSSLVRHLGRPGVGAMF